VATLAQKSLDIGSPPFDWLNTPANVELLAGKHKACPISAAVSRSCRGARGDRVLAISLGRACGIRPGLQHCRPRFMEELRFTERP
jgi:hypothetical protein